VRWEWIVVAYAGYFAIVAWTRGYSLALRGATVAALVSASVFALLPAPTGTWQIVARNWLPLVLLLAGYRLSGLFFVAPMRSVEERLLSFDRRVFDAVGWKPSGATRAPLVRGALELAYLLVYAMVPLGVVALYLAGASNELSRYWAVVLTAWDVGGTTVRAGAVVDLGAVVAARALGVAVVLSSRGGAGLVESATAAGRRAPRLRNNGGATMTIAVSSNARKKRLSIE